MKRVWIALVCGLLGVASVHLLDKYTDQKIVRFTGVHTPVREGDYMAVCYVDLRKPGQTVYYYDQMGDGSVQIVEVHRKMWWGLREYMQIHYEIEVTPERAWTFTIRNFQLKSFKGWVFLSPDSVEATQLQGLYEEVRREYLQQHPPIELRENKPRSAMTTGTAVVIKVKAV